MNTNDADLTREIFGEAIYSYSRAQALTDGVLVDVSRAAARAGFRYPVAVTAGLWGRIDIDDGVNPRSVTCMHRLGNVLLRALEAIRAVGNRDTDRVEFEALGCALWAHCGPGDTAAPVITIMREGED